MAVVLLNMSTPTLLPKLMTAFEISFSMVRMMRVLFIVFQML